MKQLVEEKQNNHDSNLTIGADLSNRDKYYESFLVKSKILLDQGRYHDFHILFVKYLIGHS